MREFGKGIRRGGSLDERGDVVASYSLCTSYRESRRWVFGTAKYSSEISSPSFPFPDSAHSLARQRTFLFQFGYGASRAVSVLSPASEKISFPPTLTSTNQRSPGANNHSVSFVNRPEKSLGSFFGSFNAPHLGAPGSRRLQNESLRVRTRVNLSQTRPRRQVRSHPRAVDARASNHDLSNLRAPL